MTVDGLFTPNNLPQTRGNSITLLVPNSRVKARADFFTCSSHYGMELFVKLYAYIALYIVVFV